MDDARCSRAMRSNRRVAVNAVSSSRRTGCDEGSPGTRKCSRSFKRASSSLWKAARRRVRARIAAIPSSSGTSSEPVDEPMKTFIPACPAGAPIRRCPRRSHACRRPRRRSRNACARAARDLIGDVGGGRGERLGVGHFEHAGDAPEDGGARTGLRISLCVAPGSRKCTCVSMTPGRRAAPAIDPLARVRARQSPISAILLPVTPMSRRLSPS